MFEFFERQRTIIQRRGQTEAIFHQRLLARTVAVIHAVQLRHGLVRFVDEHQVVARKIIEQRRRRLARQPSGEVARVVFDAMAVAHGLDHLQVVHGALVNPLRFHQVALLFLFCFPPREFCPDRLDRLRPRLRLHHVMRLGIDGQAHILLLHGAEQRIDLRKRFDFVSPQLDAIRHVVVGGENFDHVAAHAKRSAPEVAVGALVENLDQLAGNVLALDLLALLQEKQHAVIRLGRAQAVNATHRSHDQAVAPLKQRTGGREPQLVQFIVDGGFFFDVEIGGGNVGFGLVIVVVGNEIFHRVMGEEALEFVIELRRQRLVVRHHDGGPVGLLDHLGHGVGLARSRHAQQNLVLLAIEHTPNQGLEGSGLVAARFVVAD